ncbi:MAG: hypothetical protein Q9173_003917, partial [Seirophora scorigena]
MPQPLSDSEIQEFIKSIDFNNDGYVSYHEVERKLDEVANEINPVPNKHHLHHHERKASHRHRFLRSVLGTDKDRIPNDEFAKKVRDWDVPSLVQDKQKDKDASSFLKGLSWSRRVRAWWSVEGPQTCFIAFVVAMQLAFGIWQLVKYLTTSPYRHGWGWGVVVAKTSAGVLYPTMFFLLLSMSRWFATFTRHSYHLSQFINWDRSQSFHIKISIAAMALATLHVIGHLAGSFVFGSMASRQEVVTSVLGQEMSYGDYVASRPGWTGLTALACFYLIGAGSMPQVRKWSYEAFQLVHLLMFPMIATLIVHGTRGIFQWPMLGYFLAFPTLLVIIERVRRLLLSFHKIPARLVVLDDETVEITMSIPKTHWFPYEAGQYILLQVPQISFFQWHPFTISTISEGEAQVHIKADGDWTRRLKDFGKEGQELTHVGIDGPFGAPAQRFYDFDYTIIVGAGIGVTPFSGILSHMQHAQDDQWRNFRRASRPVSRRSLGSQRSSSRLGSRARSMSEKKADGGTVKQQQPEPYDALRHRRCDFHWIVKSKNNLLWFSDLLNEISTSYFTFPSCYRRIASSPSTISTSSAAAVDDLSQRQRQEANAEKHSSSNPNLSIRLTTHVTQKRPNIATHIYRHLLEAHRTPSHPKSPLTGLINPTEFGRPDLAAILHAHYADMLQLAAERKRRWAEEGETASMDEGLEEKKRRVGVFFCGPPVIGEELAARCEELTLRGRADGSGLEYRFMIE